MKLRAREILKDSADTVRQNLNGRFDLEFDDGILENVSARETIYSSYVWDLIREFPSTPLLMKHHLSTVLNGMHYSAGTHRPILESVFWDVCNTYNLNDPWKRDNIIAAGYDVANLARSSDGVRRKVKSIVKNLYEVFNNVYNLSHDLMQHIGSLDILDFYGVVDTDTYRELRKNLVATPESVSAFNSAFMRYLMSDPQIADNPLVKRTRGGVFNPSQVAKCTGAAPGYIAGLNGVILNRPILNSYLMGLSGIFETLVESNNASRALMNSQTPLEVSEFTGRRFKIGTMTVTRIHYGDCGSTEYVPFRILGAEYDENGRMLSKGDLPGVAGMYHFNQGTNRLEVIKKTDTHLVGKMVLLRHPFTCKHSDPHEICSVCFGELSQNVSPYSNIGFLCSTTLVRIISQGMLSTKHDTKSSETNALTLTPEVKQHFVIGDKGLTFMVRPDVKYDKILITIPASSALGMVDIYTIPDIEDLDTSRLSNVVYIGVRAHREGHVRDDTITLSQNKRRVHITRDLLKFIKKKGIEYDSNSNFVVDVTEFHRDKPLFYVPDKQSSLLDTISQVSRLVESRVSNLPERLQNNSHHVLLMQLYTLCNESMNIPYSLLAVIVYATMVRGYSDFRLTRGYPKPGPGVMLRTIAGRSLSGMLVYKSQRATLLDAASFNPYNRVSIPAYDVAFKPKETIEDLRAKGKLYLS